MNPIDKQLEAVLEKIRRAGGIAGIDPTAPDYMKRAFIDMIASCPDCQEEMKGGQHGTQN